MLLFIEFFIFLILFIYFCIGLDLILALIRFCFGFLGSP